MGDVIGAGLRVAVAHGLSVAGLSVAEVPLVGVDLSARGCAGELRRVALAYTGGGEVRGR